MINREAQLLSAVTDLAGRYRLPVSVRAGPLPRIAAEVETSAYLVVREALASLAKQPTARAVTIELAACGEELLLTISTALRAPPAQCH